MIRNWKEVVKAALAISVGVGMAGMPSGSAEGATIISPVAAIASNSYPDPVFGNVENLINEGGLLTPFISGVTDFDAYLAANPQHTTISAGAEWFTESGATGSTLTFDLGSVTGIDRLALWTDEFWGAGRVAVSLSTNGVLFGGVGNFLPTDWPTTVATYGADVFTFTPTAARYVQLVLSECPQERSVGGGGCGLGEVAFSQVAQPAAVPEPTTLLLLGCGLLRFAASRSRA